MKWKLLILATTGLVLSGCGNSNNVSTSPHASPAKVSYVSQIQSALKNKTSTADNTTALINAVATPPGVSLASQACADTGGDCQGAMQVELTSIPSTTDKTAFANTQFPAVVTPPGISLATQACNTLGSSKCDPGLH